MDEQFYIENVYSFFSERHLGRFQQDSRKVVEILSFRRTNPQKNVQHDPRHRVKGLIEMACGMAHLKLVSKLVLN